MTQTLRKFLADESGATALEYGLIVALISVATGGVVMQLGAVVELLYNFVLSGMESATS